MSRDPKSRPRAATMQPHTPLGPPAMSLSQSPAGDLSSDGLASGPLRHPQPLTPSDLHSMLEKEQEAIVNRLSKELSSLRQQTASVASTTSSTSATPNDELLHSPPYAANSTPMGRHRSSSSLSSSYIPAVQESRAGITNSRDTGLPFPRPGRSRQQSLNSAQYPEAKSPALSSSLHQGDSFPHRVSLSQSQRGASPTNATFRLEETAHSRAELESTKRENEALRRQVRDLELALRKSQGGDSAVVSGLTSDLKKVSVGASN